MRDKVVIVFGGNGLLGSHFVKILHSEGATVVVGDIKQSVKTWGMYDHVEAGFPVDITSELAVKCFIKSVVSSYGAIDVVINCASENPQPNDNKYSFEEYPVYLWEKQLKIDLTGLFICCREVGKQMSKQGHGIIVNMASELGFVAPDQRIYPPGFIKPAGYGVAKAGVINFTKYLAGYYGQKGIRVNCLVPAGVYNNHEPGFTKAYGSTNMLNRMSFKEEFSGALLFLCSEDNTFMTGQCLVIDGGRTSL